MNIEKIVTTFTGVLNENLGNRITPALGIGLVELLVRSLKDDIACTAEASKSTGTD